MIDNCDPTTVLLLHVGLANLTEIAYGLTAGSLLGTTLSRFIINIDVTKSLLFFTPACSSDMEGDFVQASEPTSNIGRAESD